MATPDEITLYPDFRDLLGALAEGGVEYLLVGGYAVAYHGYPRTTGDLDVWFNPTLANAERFSAVLQKWGGFRASSVPPEKLMERERVFTLGRRPLRVDFMTDADGVAFDDCYARRVTAAIDGVTVTLIGLADLRANKAASGRDKDLIDLDYLPPG